MNIYIIRNNQRFGPYSEQTLLVYVNQGQVLLHDKAIRDGDTEEYTVKYYLKQVGLKCKIASKGNIVSQLKSIGSELIFPKITMLSKRFLTDQRFLILAIVGLFPMVVMNMPFGGFLLFYEVALYFSVIWGLFFYACFKTQQVKLGTTLLVFFLTQILVFTVWDILGLYHLNPFYALLDKPFPINVIGYVFGGWLTEEFAKMSPLLFIYIKKSQRTPYTTNGGILRFDVWYRFGCI